MADVFTKSKRSQVMAQIRSTGNKATELAMIGVFRAEGVTGWRRGQVVRVATRAGSMRIRPDFVFRPRRVVVFVDGEFWHGHPTRCRIPTTRRAWWAKKIAGNRARDRRQNRALRAAGWRVVRVWQYQLKAKGLGARIGRMVGGKQLRITN